MNHLEIITKLIGPISPIGQQSIDLERLENLKEMCKLTEGLINEIKIISKVYQGCNEGSIKNIANVATIFLKNYNLEQFKCPSCGEEWDTIKHNSCSCGAWVKGK